MSNLQQYIPMLIEGTLQTVYMTIISTIFSYILGIPLGVASVVTDSNGIKPNSIIHKLVGIIINLGRSIPFIILMVALIPFTRALIGTTIGPNAAIVSLVIASTPFVARLVETSLQEVDVNLIESVRCMGASSWQIISKVMLLESLPSLIKGISITSITLVGYSAMAGAVGGKGLGDIAIRYGYHRYEYSIMLATIILLVIIVQIFQFWFNQFGKKLDKRTK